MKVVVTGAAGQLGRALTATARPGVEVLAVDRSMLDITDALAVLRYFRQVRPTHVFNAAAYTKVDGAELDPQAARASNVDAVANLAAAAREVGAHLTHVSTDFVFDGLSCRPYGPHDATGPLGSYGRSKLAGEEAAGTHALVLRTAWVYSAHGSNFVSTMLRQMQHRDEVRVVADQIGTPTWANSVAQAIWSLAVGSAQGVHHYTDSGVASWYDFAVAIQEEALARNLMTKRARIIPIATVEYPTPARRPAYSVLDKTGTYRLLGGPAPHWRVNLRHMLEDLAK